MKSFRKPVITNHRKQRKRRACVKKVMSICLLGVLFAALPALTGRASSGEAIINNSFATLRSLVAAIISAIGFIITLWGVGEWGMSMQSQDGIMQAHAFKRIGGGLVMILAPQILSLFI